MAAGAQRFSCRACFDADARLYALRRFGGARSAVYLRGRDDVWRCARYIVADISRMPALAQAMVFLGMPRGALYAPEAAKRGEAGVLARRACRAAAYAALRLCAIDSATRQQFRHWHHVEASMPPRYRLMCPTVAQSFSLCRRPEYLNSLITADERRARCLIFPIHRYH